MKSIRHTLSERYSYHNGRGDARRLSKDDCDYSDGFCAGVDTYSSYLNKSKTEQKQIREITNGFSQTAKSGDAFSKGYMSGVKAAADDRKVRRIQSANETINACSQAEGKGKNMAKQNSEQFSQESKCDYYSKRVNDSKLTDGQRRYAAKRLNELCGGKKSKPNNSSGGGYTDAQKYAYGAGIGYASAKKGKRVTVKDENKESFRKGYNKVK